MSGSRDKRKEFPSQQACMQVYTKNYCEENVYRILQLAEQKGIDHSKLFAVFISNPKRLVPFLMQKQASATNNSIVFWDYHVLPVYQRAPNDIRVYDLDSKLPFGSLLQSYVHQSIKRGIKKAYDGASIEELNTRHMGHEFRVVGWKQMKQWFSSDRRHMFAKKDDWLNLDRDQYIAKPPSKPCIKAGNKSHVHSLPKFLKMSETLKMDAFSCDDSLNSVPDPGKLLTSADALLHFFSQQTPDHNSDTRMRDI